MELRTPKIPTLLMDTMYLDFYDILSSTFEVKVEQHKIPFAAEMILNAS